MTTNNLDNSKREEKSACCEKCGREKVLNRYKKYKIELYCPNGQCPLFEKNLIEVEPFTPAPLIEKGECEHFPSLDSDNCMRCNKPMTSLPDKEEWDSKFEELFGYELRRPTNKFLAEPLKSFIKEVLTSQSKSYTEQIRGMKRTDEDQFGEDRAYDEAIDDIISLIDKDHE